MTHGEWMRLPAKGLAGAVRLYQMVFSPIKGPTCRYYPSCSSYAITALRTHGLVRGGALAVWRLARCNPWSPGGVDHVPPAQKDSRFVFLRTTEKATHGIS
jgi:putative membrane protein insertion efficiency factor